MPHRAPSWRSWIGTSRARTGPVIEDGSRIAVVGGGPAGSFFAHFALDLAQILGRRVEVDIYEPRDFASPAPAGCNMCGGIVSESLVQLLAAEGIVLPPSVIQRGIDSYVLHTDEGSVRIGTPLEEMRVGAVHRGLGPRDVQDRTWSSFDGFLQSMAIQKGARIVPRRVVRLSRTAAGPEVALEDGTSARYELLVVACGVNSDATKLIDGLRIGYRAPETATTFIREYFLGRDVLDRTLGHSMHVFLLDVPGLEFAAIIPKGAYATVCLLGNRVDKRLAESFMNFPAVRACFPEGLELPYRSCQCAPRINVRGAHGTYADRVLILGDCGVTRLYKDGIGAAYRTAKTAAAAALLHGVSAETFRRHLAPALRSIERDNRLGRIVFAVTRIVQRVAVARRAVLIMTSKEQQRQGSRRRMSQVLWDVFTGSAPYRSVLLRSLHPGFWAPLLGRLVAESRPGPVRAGGAPGVRTRGL